MATRSKFELHQRLDTYFATLRPSSLKEALRHSAGNWQIYAAVTGSAIAMATGASAAVIQSGTDDIAANPTASVVPANLHLASSNTPLINAMKLAVSRARATQATQAQATQAQTTQTQAQAPSISPNGIVPLYSTVPIIQAGEWVSIYGSNLAAETTMWNNDFPQSLGGTSVTINNRPAYLLFVSPGQINLQAPDDTATGTVPVVVTTAAGSVTSTVTLGQVGPSFSLIDTKHVSGIILRTDGSGAFGNGSYDILGPTGYSLGYKTLAAKANDSVVLFGFGFGPTTPTVPAGQVFSEAAPINDRLRLFINSVSVGTTFTGISSAGVYQINLRIPYGLGTGDVPIQAMVSGVETPAGVVIPLEDPAISGSGGYSGTVITPVPVGTVPAPPFLSSYPVGGTFGGGTFGGGSDGGGGGMSSDARKRHFEPKKLQFPPKPK